MDAAATIEGFLARPVGRYVSGASYIVWVRSPRLIGNVYFGRPDERDLADHRRMFDLPAHPDLAPPFDVLLDAHLLDGADRSCYDVLAGYAAHKLPGFVRLVRRMAIIPPHGFVGALTLGIVQQVVAPRFRARVCADLGEALGWLGHGDARAEIDAAIDAVCSAPPVIARVRARLADDLTPSIDAVARSLGVSERTLQRELRRAGSSFREEVSRARVVRAERLLRDTSLKLEAIARRVGYSSLAHFSARFRRLRGVSPTEFRGRAGRASRRSSRG